MMDYLDKISKGKIVLIFLAFFILMSIIINGKPFGVKKLKEISGGVGILDLEFNYTVDEAYDILDGLGEKGRVFYYKIIFLDFIFPLSYLLFLLFCINYFLIKIKILPKILLIFPLIVLLSDYTENICNIILLSNYPERLVKLVQFENIVCMIKFIGMFVCYFIILVEIIIFIILRIRNKKVKSS
jgi:hypothetical protein